MQFRDIEAFLNIMTEAEIAYFNVEIKNIILEKLASNSVNQAEYCSIFFIVLFFIFKQFIKTYIQDNAEVIFISHHDFVNNYKQIQIEDTYSLLLRLYANFSEAEAFSITVDILAKVLI